VLSKDDKQRWQYLAIPGADPAVDIALFDIKTNQNVIYNALFEI
jgi:hypothetical protein